jgi:beta-glucanase (GH16 family)
MKYFFICIVLAVFSSRIEGAWHQVWEDDFNGTTLDESKWTYDQGCDGGFSIRHSISGKARNFRMRRK